MSKGDFKIESNVQKTFIGKRNSWRNDAISDGGGVASAESVTVQPSDPSNNEVEVNEKNYTINGETTTLNEGDTYKNIFGGYATVYATSIGNKIIINGGNISSLIGGRSDSGTVSDNNIKFINGTIGTVYGGWGYGTISKNEILMKGGNATYLIGGFCLGTGQVGSNNVNISNGQVNNIIAGRGVNSDVIENSVEISGGEIKNVVAGETVNGTLKENYIKITGGKITAVALASGVLSINGGTTNVNAINNWIEIHNSPNLSTANIWGYQSSVAEHSGNALNIHTTGITAQNIANFDIIRFYLPSNVDTVTPVLTLTATNTDISGAQVLAGVEGNANLNVGDTVTLLTNAGTITDTGTTYGKLTEGVSLEYDLTVKKDGDNKIIATIGSASPTPTTPATPTEPETPITPTDPVTPSNPVFNRKTDILPKFPMPILPPPELPDDIIDFDSEGLDSFFENEQKGWEVFAKVGAGPMRYKVNNGHIDTTNQNIDLGFARNIGNTAGKMTIAPIIDHQNTNFDSYLDDDDTHARGNSKYTGGGFILRNLYRSGLYYETSFRMGRNKTDFASEDLDTTGNFGTITYDTSQTVWNAHLKLGKYIRFDKNNLLNVYGFYYHTHQGGSGADLSSGEHYNFSSANAGRARIGYRMTTRTSKISQVYTGLAYQFEHNSGVTAKYKDFSTDGENHNGSSGMLEIGWIIKPLKDNPWAVDINATGWIGNQRGVKAFAKIQKAF